VARLTRSRARFCDPAISRRYHHDARARAFRRAGSIGYRNTVMWTIDSMGWGRWSTNSIYQRVVKNADNGSIILMHVGAAWRDAAALNRIVTTLNSRGYNFGAVAQLMA
jgi:peptidoglycan/xylan/chitin deacetylase (PgdA/CDA1 family)